MPYANIVTPSLLRKALAALLLLLGLSAQAQLVFACDLQEGAKSTVCCCGAQMDAGCDAGGGCALPTGNTTASCCDVGLDTPQQLTAVTVPAGQAVVLQQAPQPPPALPVACVTWPLAGSGRYSLVFAGLPSWLPGTDIYLHTLRFRS